MDHYMNHAFLRNYMSYRTELYNTLIPGRAQDALLSEANWIERGHCSCGEEIGIHVNPGDICYMDFGQAYLNEIGFQHFGLVMTVWQRKAMVIPMTSNPNTYERAWDAKENPEGKKNLMRLGSVPGLTKPSVLFLNDMRFVNTARVIDIKAHLDVSGAQFQSVKQRIFAHLFRSALS